MRIKTPLPSTIICRRRIYMQFDETKTYKNLARSFAGESQAGMRYQLIARAAISVSSACCPAEILLERSSKIQK